MNPVWAVQEVDTITMDAHEDTVRSTVESLFPTGGVFVDIGAQVGLYTVLLGMRASRVIAVEPNPAAAVVLLQNIVLNNLTDVAMVLELAAWDSTEQLALDNPSPHFPKDPRSGWMRVMKAEGGIAGRRLDDVLLLLPQQLDRIDLVKVDTEGSDVRALRGMKYSIQKFKPILFVETHTNKLFPYGYPFEELTALIDELGYDWEWGPTWLGSEHIICRPRES